MYWIILTAITKDITKSSNSPGLAAKLFALDTKFFSSDTSILLLILILSCSTNRLRNKQPSILLLCVVWNPFLPFLPCILLGSCKKSPGKVSSPVSLITTRAASPIALFSTDQYSWSHLHSFRYIKISNMAFIWPSIGVLLWHHSATCVIVDSSNTCIAALSPPVPELGSNATTKIESGSGCLYQRVCPILRFGSTPFISKSFKASISVSS